MSTVTNPIAQMEVVNYVGQWIWNQLRKAIAQQYFQSSEFQQSVIQGHGKRNEIRQFTIYYAGSLGRWDKQIVNQASDVPSIIYFFS